MNQVIQILVEARKLIDTPDKWCQNSLAKSDFGNVEVISPIANRFCLNGSIVKARLVLASKYPLNQFEFASQKAFEYIEDHIEKKYGNSYSYYSSRWNDDKNRTHEDVMRLFDEVIEGQTE